MGTKVIVNTAPLNRVSINNQQRETIRTVGIGGSDAGTADMFVLRAGDTIPGIIGFTTANSLYNVGVGAIQTNTGIDLFASAGADWAQLNYDNTRFIWVDTAGAHMSTGNSGIDLYDADGNILVYLGGPTSNMWIGYNLHIDAFGNLVTPGNLSSGYLYGNGAFLTGVTTNLAPVFTQANSAYDRANSAYNLANNVAPQIAPAFDTANAAFVQANAAYNKANSALANANTTLAGSLITTGHLAIGNIANVDFLTRIAGDASALSTKTGIIVQDSINSDLSTISTAFSDIRTHTEYTHTGSSAATLINGAYINPVISANSTGPVTSFIGLYPITRNLGSGALGTMWSLLSRVDHNGSGPVTTILNNDARNYYNGSGNVSTAFNFVTLTALSSSGNLANNAGLYIYSPTATGTGRITTTNYGVYIAQQNVPAVSGNSWNFYSAGSTARNQIEGYLNVGGIWPSTSNARLKVTDTLTLNAVPTIDVQTTWNNTSNTSNVFTALQLNVTDTNSASGSLLMDLKRDGTSIFSISKLGDITIGASYRRLYFPSIWYINNALAALRNDGGVNDYFHINGHIGLGYPTTADVRLWRDAAAILAQRDGTVAQTSRIYGTYTDASNYERLAFTANSTGSYIQSEALGTGVLRQLRLSSNNAFISLSDSGGAVFGYGTAMQLIAGGPISINTSGGVEKARFQNGTGYLGLLTTSPANPLTVAGATSIGAAYTGTVAPANGLIVQTTVGIGTTTPLANLHVVGDAIFTGNLTVSGNTTYMNTQTLLIGDNILVLNADLPNTAPPTEDAGFEINRGNQPNTSIIWNEANLRWDIRSNTTNLVSITANGLMGIGTVPDKMLTMYSTSTTGGIKVGAGPGNHYVIVGQTAGSSAYGGAYIPFAYYYDNYQTLIFNYDASAYPNHGNYFEYGARGSNIDQALYPASLEFFPRGRRTTYPALFMSNNALVGIGTRAPQAKLHVVGNTILGNSSTDITTVNGTLAIDSLIEFNTANSPALTGAQTVISTFSAGQYRGGKFTIFGRRGSDTHITEVLLTHNYANTFWTEYGTVYTNGSLFNMSANLVSGNVNVILTPTSTADFVFEMLEQKFISNLNMVDRTLSPVLDRSGSAIVTRAA